MRTLDSSQQSIKTTSEHLVNLVDQDDSYLELVVQMWARYILRVPRSRKVAFAYLANELIQNSFIKSTKKKNLQVENPPAHWRFYKVFAPPSISEVFLQLVQNLNAQFTEPQPRDLVKQTHEINQAVLQVVQVWVNRSIYENLTDLKN